MRLRHWVLFLAAGAACGEPEPAPQPVDTGAPADLSGCETGGDTEVFFGLGVGGAFELLEPGAQVTLVSAPQGGFGVSVLVGTRGLQAGAGEWVTAELVSSSDTVPEAGSTFALNAALECRTDAPEGAHGIIYGVVVGFSSSLSNDQLLELHGTEAELTVSVSDATGATATGSHVVTLIVGE